MQIQITLPISSEDWDKLLKLKAIFSTNSSEITEDFLVQELSDDDKNFLDSELEKAFVSGETTVLDNLAINGAGKNKPSIRDLIFHFMKNNNGVGSRHDVIEYIKTMRPDIKNSKRIDNAANDLHIIKDMGMWQLPTEA